MAEKGTDLKGKRLSSPHRIVYKLIINVKGMNVISHRLRPVPIDRWTVPHTIHADLYLLLRHACTFCLLSSRRYFCNSILFLPFHDYIKWINNDIWLFILFSICHMLRLSLMYTVMMKVRPSWHSSKDRYILREIMLRRTKDINI